MTTVAVTIAEHIASITTQLADALRDGDLELAAVLGMEAKTQLAELLSGQAVPS
jgi:hypothetical protein